jgi:Domain of unknown function (DUF4384)
VSNDEIQKLLGGYATNTLTEAERKALFEAALEDQQLFDALHQEQALKDLLDDPISRHQIRQALEEPAFVKTHAAWWTRWWAWAGAASAVAAAVLIVAVTRPHSPELKQQSASLDRATTAPVPPTEKSERDAETEPKKLKAPAAPQPSGARVARESKGFAMRRETRADATLARNASKDESASTAPRAAVPAANAPAAPTPPPLSTQQVQVEAQAPTVGAVPSQSRGSDTQALSQQAQPQVMVNSLRDQKQEQLRQAQLSAGVGGGFSKAPPPVSYSLLKRDESGAYQPLPPDAELQTGDEVRLTVSPTRSGYLSLSRQDAAGQWTRVFPEAGPGLPVNANANYTIPDSPIDVTDLDQTLRLTLVPASMIGASSTGQVKAKTAPLKKESASSTPLVVDLTIGPKKVP